MHGVDPAPTQPSVSVVLLSHKRPHLLRRVVHGVRQLDYPNFEIGVVGDQTTIDDFGLPRGWAAQIRYAQFTEQNICKARNIGITLAAGQIVAFCDDDAVPEPNWLSELVVPFQTPTVAAAAGLVRGADGISIEWQGGWFDRAGTEEPVLTSAGLQIVGGETQIATGKFLGLMGVNTAFRRTALCQVGGFDEAYRYYLDETDVALRLAVAGWSTALVPSSEVHHLREANEARDALKTPRNLYQIAASKAYFCRQHLPAQRFESAMTDFRETRDADLDPYLRLGVLRGAGRKELLQQLDQGARDGVGRKTQLPLKPTEPVPAFQRFESTLTKAPIRIAVITGWGVGKIRRLRTIARTLARAGHNVTCISFLSGIQGTRVSFANGLWMHHGGTWQIADLLDRDRPVGRASRAMAELERIRSRRKIDLIIRSGSNPGQNERKLDVPSNLGPLVARSIGIQDGKLGQALHEISLILGNQAAEQIDHGSNPETGANAAERLKTGTTA